MQARVDPSDGSISFEKVTVDTGVTYFLESARKEQEDSQKKGKDSIIGNVNERFCPEPSMLSVEEKRKLVNLVGEEIIKESELEKLFKEKTHPICYDGFEPSGRMHIA
jgi:tyrosyl-tRNA synthetase